MNLATLAEADNAIILEDIATGFGRAATFQAPTVSPDPAPAPIVVGVQFIRRGVKLDPNTGLMVQADEAYVTARITSLGATMPTDGWTVTVADSSGVSCTYKIEPGKVMQDRTLGRVTFGPLKKAG